jgi:hypothetical protein
MSSGEPDDAGRQSLAGEGPGRISTACAVTFSEDEYCLCRFEPEDTRATCPGHGEMDELELLVNRDGCLWMVSEGYCFWVCEACLDAVLSTRFGESRPARLFSTLAKQNWETFRRYLTAQGVPE